MEIDADIRLLTNNALANPRSFFTRNNVGALVLIPHAARIVFFSTEIEHVR